MNKIGFVTNYDESTNANFNIAKNALPPDSINLLSTDAIRANFLNLLGKHTEYDVFAFSHGNSDRFYENNGGVAYSVADTLFADRKVFIYACFTSNILGKKTSNLNCIYWGYTGQIAALEDDILSQHIFVNIVSDILMKFSSKKTKEEITDYLDELKIMCEQGAEQLDDLYEKHPTAPISGYNTLNDIWNRLRVYFKSEHIILHHPDAQTGDLFEK